MVGIWLSLHCLAVLCDCKIDMEIPIYDSEEKLWMSFSVENDYSIRSKLIAKYMPLAKYHASVLYKNRMDDDVDFEDYLQYANIGLIEAIDNFDLSRNVMFGSYASHRIKGAILNGISTFTEKREQLSLRRRLHKERIDSLVHDKDSTFEQMVDITLGLAISFILSDTSLIQEEDSVDNNTPYQQETLYRLNLKLRELLDVLTSSEKAVITKHYFEHKKFIEIAQSLNLTRGRVSQIHKNAICKLRLYTKKEEYDDIL